MTRFSRLISGWLAVSLVTLAALGTSPAHAQLKGFEDLTGDLKSGGATGKAEFTVTLTPSTAKPGDEVTLTIDVKLPAEHYIYATTEKSGARTQINTKATGLEAIDAEFTAERGPKAKVDTILNETYTVFYDKVTWKKRYRISKDAEPASVSVSGELTGQYCSEGDGGKCHPINPPFEFKAVLGDAAAAPVTFEYEERPNRGKDNPALLRFHLSPQDAKPGDKVTLSITMELDKGWHTFSLNHKGDGGTATEIALDELSGLKTVGTDFQPDHPHEVEKDEELGLTLLIHNGKVTWSRELEVTDQPGTYGVKGRITYQTCKNRCLPPREVEFSLGVVPESPTASRNTPQVTNVDPPPKSIPEGPEAIAANPAAPVAPVAGHRPQDKGLLRFILTAVGFGFVSLLTPCVFPMIPITVSFFLKQSESEHHRPATTAFVFCGSIVATFTVLGLGIAAIFGAAQVNALANNSWLNVFIGLVFVTFALNMLGLFEIRVPSSLLTFTANKEQAGGYLGAMFMALTFTLTSFTCTFAFAGTLLVGAAGGDYYWPVIGMLAFGTAFASPFFVLAMVPSLLKKLPKSGGWMNTIKVVMGLIEIGAAIKFWSVADFAWNPVEPFLFDFVFVMLSWLVLSLVIGLYLLGVFRMAHDVPPAGLSVMRLAMAVAFLGLSGNLAVALLKPGPGGGWVMEQIVSMAPPQPAEDVPAVAGGHPTNLPEPNINHHGIWYALDFDKAVAHAAVVNQPILLDFTGVNCANCRKMELRMPKAHNRSRLEKFVLVQLYVDTVPISDPVELKRLLVRNRNLQKELLNDSSMPEYAVVTPDGKTLLASFTQGLESKEGEFAAFLDEGWKNWEQMQPKAKGVEVVNKP